MGDREIANIIYQQLGSKRFTAMVGAKNFVVISKGIQFQMPWPRINMVRITLTPADEYAIQYIKYRGTTTKIVAQENGVQVAELRESFERNTGLRTSL